jgi:hypothetical protein
MRVCHERVSHPSCERTGGGSHQVAIGVRDISPSHRDDLCNDPEERLLEADSDADENLADDKGVHVLCESTDDAADECNYTTDDEEPCRPLSVF